MAWKVRTAAYVCTKGSLIQILRFSLLSPCLRLVQGLFSFTPVCICIYEGCMPIELLPLDRFGTWWSVANLGPTSVGP